MKNELIIFENQNVKLEVNMKDETVWLSLEQLAKLFDRDKSVISRHIKNVLKEELKNEVVVAKFATTAKDGKTYKLTFTFDSHDIYTWVTIEENFAGNSNPYGGANVHFNGEYEKIQNY